MSFAMKIYRQKEAMREQVAEETFVFWRENGVLNTSHLLDSYKVKEAIMECLEKIDAP